MVVVPCGRGGLSADDRSLVGRACGLASELGVPVLAALVGGAEDDAGQIKGPADAVVIPVSASHAADHGPVVATLAGMVRDAGCLAVLAPGTRAGNEIAARLAARLGAGFAAGCRSLEIDADGAICAERDVYAGRATATVAFAGGSPVIATVVPGLAYSGPRGPSGAGVTPAVRVFDIPLGATPAVEVERTWHPGPWEMQLSEAEVVVAGGRGVCSPEDFELLAELAGLLGGAVAASRPVVDAGLLPVSRQVGLSGQTVAPRLYIAVGISGSPHHVIGMRGAGSVVAINRDPHAPIFERADVRLVGDAREILADLISRLRAAGQRPAVERAAGLAGLLQV